MAVSDAYVFPGFLTPVLTQLFFPKPPTTFFTCFCRGERQKYAGKKSGLNQGSNSKPPGHKSDVLTTEPPGRGTAKVTSKQIMMHLIPNQSNMSYFVLKLERNESTVIYSIVLHLENKQRNLCCGHLRLQEPAISCVDTLVFLGCL